MFVRAAHGMLGLRTFDYWRKRSRRPGPSNTAGKRLNVQGEYIPILSEDLSELKSWASRSAYSRFMGSSSRSGKIVARGRKTTKCVTATS